MAETLVGWNGAKGYGVPALGLIDQAEAGLIIRVITEPIAATDMQRRSMPSS